MRLLTVGDSFTYGAELSGTLCGPLEPHEKAWPNLLAKKLGYTLTNLARPGSGNTRMIRLAITELNNYDLVIVAWSHFARVEWADQKGIYDMWPGCSVTPHSTVAPWRKYLIDHISHHYDDNYLYRQYLLNIILTQNFLKSQNKRYLMLDSFGNHQSNARMTFSNQSLLDQIDKTYYLGWPNESMMEWTYKTPQGPGGHFLHQGHEQVAEKIYQHMEQLSWLS